jgi:hypothetical protein
MRTAADVLWQNERRVLVDLWHYCRVFPPFLPKNESLKAKIIHENTAWDLLDPKDPAEEEFHPDLDWRGLSLSGVS